MTRGRGFLRTAAERYGIPELAHHQHLDESTLRNQIEYRRRHDKRESFWRPSWDTGLVLFFSERRFRDELLSITDERIEAIEIVTPEDALREVVAWARSKKYGEQFADDFSQLYQRVKKGSSR